MSVHTKKRFKNLGKIIGVVLFVALMLTNIKIAVTDEAELAHSNFTIFGIEISLQNDTYARKIREGQCGEICYIVPDRTCTYIVEYGYCDGAFK